MPVTVHFNAGADFILSCLVAVNAESGEVVFDRGADRNANRRLAGANRAVFVTFVDRIRIQFAVTGSIREIDYDGSPAFAVAFPDSVARLQRREFYRVQPLMSRPASARLPDPQANIEDGEVNVEFRILDIGAGGAGLLAMDDHPFQVGVPIEGCMIDLPDAGSFAVTADIGYRQVGAGPKGKGFRYGLRFRKILPAAANTIQKYIMKVDRERNSKR